MKKPTPYYNLNVMIFPDEGGFAYSVIQEFDEAGKDREVLISGQADTLLEALLVVKTTVYEALQ